MNLPSGDQAAKSLLGLFGAAGASSRASPPSAEITIRRRLLGLLLSIARKAIDLPSGDQTGAEEFSPGTLRSSLGSAPGSRLLTCIPLTPSFRTPNTSLWPSADNRPTPLSLGLNNIW